MIQNYVSAHTTDGYSNPTESLPPDGTTIQSASVDSLVFSRFGAVTNALTFSCTASFPVLGPDDHAFSCRSGFEIEPGGVFYQRVSVQYLDSSGRLVHSFTMPLFGGGAAKVDEYCFSVPSFQSSGAVTIQLVVTTGFGQTTYAGVYTELRYAKPRKLLQYGK